MATHDLRLAASVAREIELSRPPPHGYTRSPKAGTTVASVEWRDRAYEENFEAVFGALEARRKVDACFGIEDAEGVLRALYVQEGNDDGSRGMLNDAVLAATIAAHEQFIAMWKAEGAAVEPRPIDRSCP